MFNELLVTAILVPFVTFAVWFMKIAVVKFINTLDELLKSNKELANIIKNELKDLKDEVRRNRR